MRQPKAFLFDEPLSNLDAALRVNMRLEIARLQNSLGTTAIYVTHDQVEAMTMADKIVVLNAGKVEQVGSPLELYARPDNLFVAGFIGSPKMNLVAGDDRRRSSAARRSASGRSISTCRASGGDVAGDRARSPSISAPTRSSMSTSTGVGRVTVRAPGEFALEGRAISVWLDAEAGAHPSLRRRRPGDPPH